MVEDAGAGGSTTTGKSGLDARPPRGELKAGRRALVKEAKVEAAKNRIQGAAPFKPTGTGNSIPQPSILFHTYGSGAN